MCKIYLSKNLKNIINDFLTKNFGNFFLEKIKIEELLTIITDDCKILWKIFTKIKMKNFFIDIC